MCIAQLSADARNVGDRSCNDCAQRAGCGCCGQQVLLSMFEKPSDACGFQDLSAADGCVVGVSCLRCAKTNTAGCQAWDAIEQQRSAVRAFLIGCYRGGLCESEVLKQIWQYAQEPFIIYGAQGAIYCELCDVSFGPMVLKKRLHMVQDSDSVDWKHCPGDCLTFSRSQAFAVSEWHQDATNRWWFKTFTPDRAPGSVDLFSIPYDLRPQVKPQSCARPESRADLTDEELNLLAGLGPLRWYEPGRWIGRWHSSSNQLLWWSGAEQDWTAVTVDFESFAQLPLATTEQIRFRTGSPGLLASLLPPCEPAPREVEERSDAEPEPVVAHARWAPLDATNEARLPSTLTLHRRCKSHQAAERSGFLPLGRASLDLSAKLKEDPSTTLSRFREGLKLEDGLCRNSDVEGAAALQRPHNSKIPVKFLKSVLSQPHLPWVTPDQLSLAEKQFQQRGWRRG